MDRGGSRTSSRRQVTALLNLAQSSIIRLYADSWSRSDMSLILCRLLDASASIVVIMSY